MELDEALELLRDPELGVIDLTGRNVQRLKDKRAKQVLEQVLRKVLPRRQKGVERSSYYRALRAKLLPNNPYFRQDVAYLRGLFHIPEGQIADIELTQFADRPRFWSKVDTLDSADAVGYWLQIHRCITAGAQLDPDLPPLPQWLIDSASKRLEFIKTGADWLQKKPNIPALYVKRFDLSIPIDWCVARLIQRYQLPWKSGPNLRFFILTQASKYLEGISPFDVMTKWVMAPIGEAFRITVDWIDEYTTRQQWDEIFDRYIKPWQDYFWEKRGELPHSRQIDVDGLTQPWVAELYNLLAEKEAAGQKIGVDRALELLSTAEKLPSNGVDRATAYRLVKKLDVLCGPKD